VLVNGVLLAVRLYYGLLAVERVIRSAGDGNEPERSLPAPRSGVTVQVPVYDERHIVDRPSTVLKAMRLPEVIPDTGILR
jgi:hypothetical protein